MGERSGGGTLMIIWFEKLSQLSAMCPPPKHEKPAPKAPASTKEAVEEVSPEKPITENELPTPKSEPEALRKPIPVEEVVEGEKEKATVVEEEENTKPTIT